MSTTFAPRVVQIVADIAELPAGEVRDDETLEDLGYDSLHLTELLVKAHKEFGVELQEGELSPELTVGQIVAYLNEKMA